MDVVLACCEGGVATLTLNRPQSMNAINPALVQKLKECLSWLADDPEVRVIIITGAGRGFCAGGDIKTMGDGRAGDFHQKLARMRRLHELTLVLAQYPKPTIAMINGPAMGAGLGLALCCDFRFMARSAKLGASFVRVGMSSDFGASWLLPRLAGRSKAREYLLTGRSIDSAEALAAGLVTQVVDDDQLREATRAWAAQFATGPTVAYQYIKKNLVAGEDLSLAELLDLEAINQVAAVDTHDHREAVAAFVEKRQPNFGGN